MLRNLGRAGSGSDTIATNRLRFVQEEAACAIHLASRRKGNRLSLQQRWREIRDGFESAFWVANSTEIFERVAYYSTQAVLAIFLTEQMHFSAEVTGSLMG